MRLKVRSRCDRVAIEVRSRVRSRCVQGCDLGAILSANEVRCTCRRGDVWNGTRDVWYGTRAVWYGTRDVWYCTRDVWYCTRDVWYGTPDVWYDYVQVRRKCAGSTVTTKIYNSKLKIYF